jgi:hypothetical protein
MSSNLKKQKAEQKLAAQKKSDLVLYKLMVFFCLAIVGVAGVMTIGRGMLTQAKFLTNVLPILLIVAGLALAASIVWYAMCRSRHVDESGKIITSANLMGTAIVFFLSCLYNKLSSDVFNVLVFFIVAIVLYFVYHIFRRDFFLCSIAAAAGFVLIKLSTISQSSAFGFIFSTACGILAIVAPVVFIVFGIVLHANKGVFLKKKLIDKGDHIYPMLIVSGISLAGALAAFFVPAAAIYAIVVILAAYLALAVANTIRMM